MFYRARSKLFNFTDYYKRNRLLKKKKKKEKNNGKIMDFVSHLLNEPIKIRNMNIFV